MTTRPGEIKLWLASLFPNTELRNLNYIQSDASDRRYLRFSLTGLSFIIMDSKPGPDMINFIKIANLLAQNKITVPQIIATDVDRGLILMNDLGAQTYLKTLKNADFATTNKLYTDAMTALIKMQSLTKGQNIYELPLMNREYIDNRLNVFNTWYLQQHLKTPDDSTTNVMISNLRNIFHSIFKSQPQVFVHLDYHSRNLMHIPSSNNPGILDFQDAMYGPLTYDLASLFQDAYITWPRTYIEKWIKTYQDMALEAGLISNNYTYSDLLRQFDLVGLQRHIKNLGVFARLHHRDNKSNYLQDMPTLFNYIIETCNRYPELSTLLDFLKGNILEAGLIDVGD